MTTPQFVLRKIRYTDFDKNYLQVLSQLSPTCSNIFRSEFNEYLNFINLCTESYYIAVIEDTSKNIIVGTGTLLVEYKLIHHLGKVGHIEDIVIDDKYRGHGLGKMLMDHLKAKAKEMECYKVILNCKEDVASFYQDKCEFIKNGVEMRFNIV